MSILCMLEKDCNGNPTLLCISDELAPRQIQSISCNVRNRKKNFETVVDTDCIARLSAYIVRPF